MKHLILSLICLCLSALSALSQCGGTDIRDTLTLDEQAELSQRVQAMPYNRGNHWTATRGDKTIHLIGTIHMADPRLANHFNALKPLIAEADLLLVEMTRAEQASLEKSVVERPALVFLTTGPTLPDLMDEAEWQTLKTAAEARGIPGFMAAKFQPWYLSLMLSMPGCAIRQMQSGASGMDHLIMDHASASDVPQRSLEPYDTLFTLMSRDPLEKQVEYLHLGSLPDAMAADSMATMFAGYFEERTAEIMEFGRIIARRYVDLPPSDLDALIDEMYALLLDARNRAWIPVILDAPDGLIVLAAGAGHLPGDQGLLRLLENEGFALTRQPF